MCEKESIFYDESCNCHADRRRRDDGPDHLYQNARLPLPDYLGGAYRHPVPQHRVLLRHRHHDLRLRRHHGQHRYRHRLRLHYGHLPGEERRRQADGPYHPEDGGRQAGRRGAGPHRLCGLHPGVLRFRLRDSFLPGQGVLPSDQEVHGLAGRHPGHGPVHLPQLPFTHTLLYPPPPALWPWSAPSSRRASPWIWASSSSSA